MLSNLILLKKIHLEKLVIIIAFLSIGFAAHAQNVEQIKKELEATTDPIGYANKLNKKYKIDTIDVISTSSFMDITDSIAYCGKEGKVYGPFKGRGQKYIIKILGKAPNIFYHVSHIQLDTFLFRPRFADSLADAIIKKIKSGSATFESMAILYSSDRSSPANGGDLGWFSRGAMLPQLDKAIAAHKKGDVFKVWTTGGVHIIKITDDPRKDTGFALVLKVIL
jgi:hypothetical protein